MKEKILESKLLEIIFCQSYTCKKCAGKKCKWMWSPFAPLAHLDLPSASSHNWEQPHGFSCLSSQGICNTAPKSQRILHFCPYPLLLLTHLLPISHCGPVREIGISAFGLSSCARTRVHVYFLEHIHLFEVASKWPKNRYILQIPEDSKYHCCEVRKFIPSPIYLGQDVGRLFLCSAYARHCFCSLVLHRLGAEEPGKMTACSLLPVDLIEKSFLCSL